MTRLVMRDRALARITFLAESDQHERAVAMLDSLLSSYPDDPEVQRLAADVREGRQYFLLVSQVRALRDQKQYDRALAVLDSAVPRLTGQRVASEAAVVLLRKGYDLQNQGRTTAARQAFEAARLRDGGNAEVGRALADLEDAARYATYSRREEVVRTPKSQRRAEVADVGHSELRVSTASAVEIGDTARAGALLQEGYVAIAERGDTALAIAKYEEVCRITGTGTSCYQRAAVKLQKLGRRAPSPSATASNPVVEARPAAEATPAPGSRALPGPSEQPHASATAQVERSSVDPADYRMVSYQEQKRRQAKAKELYWEGFGLLNDLKDTARSVEKFRQVRDTVQDPSYEFHQKATEWLRKLRKL
jgi:tetratricopeptide (TPR) repeat protein